MRFLLLIAALSQFACAVHYRFSADETRRLAGFDVHDEHAIETEMPAVAVGNRDAAVVVATRSVTTHIPSRPYRLVHRSGYSIEFDSETRLAFALRDGTATGTSEWRSIQIEGDKWVAAPMDESVPKVSVPLDVLDGSVAEVRSPGRTGAVVGGLLSGVGAILLVSGIAKSSGENGNSSTALIVCGGPMLSAGLITLIGSAITGWHLKADD